MTHFADYRLDKTSTYIINEEGDEICFCQRIEVTDVFTDVITGIQKINVRITDVAGAINVLLDREVLVGDVLKPLCARGLEVSSEKVYAVTVAEILMLTEQSATKHFTHDVLGFHRDYMGQLRFFSAETIDDLTPVSRHVEYERYRSQGTFEEWYEKIKPYLEGRPELQLALVMGLTAPVASLLMMENVLSTTPIYALIGNSSSGKSTALKTAASSWARASADSGGIDLLIDTDSYMLAKLSSKHGYPALYDDSSTIKASKDLTPLIYTLASSNERGRCYGDGTPRAKRSWSGTIIFTGEQSMLSQNSALKGKNARVIEFNLPWTADAESAEAISKICGSYYGTAHVKFIKNLISKPKNIISRDFEEAVALLSEKFEVKDGIQRRQTQLFAVLVVTLKYAQEVFDFDFDINAIDRILEDTYRANAESEPEADRLYEKLIGAVLANRDRYPLKGQKCYLIGSAYGEEGTFNNRPCFWIIGDRFVSYLEAAGYKDTKFAVRMLHAGGFLAKFSGDRFRTKHRIGGIEVLCYALFINSSRPTTPPKKKQKKRRDIKRVVNLLAEEEEDCE